jgi:hypothetical protein
MLKNTKEAVKTTAQNIQVITNQDKWLQILMIRD